MEIKINSRQRGRRLDEVELPRFKMDDLQSRRVLKIASHGASLEVVKPAPHASGGDFLCEVLTFDILRPRAEIAAQFFR